MGFTVIIRNSANETISRFNTGIEWDFEDLPALIIDELNDQPAITNSAVWALIIDKWDFEKWEICLKRNGDNWRVSYCNLINEFE